MKERIEEIDIAKGILMSLVVIGHIITMLNPISAFVKSFIYTFHVPAFFIISGILTRKSIVDKYSLVIFTRRKIKSLIVPYLLFELMAAISQMMILGTEYINLKGAVIGTIFIYCNGGATWFLPTLFFSELMVYVLVVIERKSSQVFPNLLVILCFIGSVMLPKSHMCIVVSRCLMGGVLYLGWNTVRKQIIPFSKYKEKTLLDGNLCNIPLNYCYYNA